MVPENIWITKFGLWASILKLWSFGRVSYHGNLVRSLVGKDANVLENKSRTWEVFWDLIHFMGSHSCIRSPIFWVH